MYSLLKIEIFQPAMLIYQRVRVVEHQPVFDSMKFCLGNGVSVHDENRPGPQRKGLSPNLSFS